MDSGERRSEMPFGMGPSGWFFWPYMAFWMRQGYPHWNVPYFPYPWFFTEEQEEDFLEGQAEALEKHLAQIKKRLEELKKRQKEKK